MSIAKYLLQPTISSQNYQSFLIEVESLLVQIFQTDRVRSGESRVQTLHCWSLWRQKWLGFCDGGLSQKASAWAKSGHTLPLLCTASGSSLGPPWWHISLFHEAFFLWFFSGLTEWCHWYTLQQNYTSSPKITSVSLCKVASAIWITEIGKKKFWQASTCSQGRPFLNCLIVPWVNRAYF